MEDKNSKILTRREFAQRAALLSATASLAGPKAVFPTSAKDGDPQAAPKLTEAGQAEAEARCQQIISLYGRRFDDAQKAELKRMCAELQPSIDHIRSYALPNGDAPALYLKPLVEREKKAQVMSTPATKKS